MNNVSMSYSKKVSDTNSHANKMNNENKRLEDADGEEELAGEEATLYRSVVARFNYL